MSIRDDFFTAQAKASLWDVAVSIKRGNPLPLDANSVFKALGTVDGADYAGSLLEYATSNPVAYPGQICAVVGENATTIYYLDQNLAIQPVGIIPTGDGKTIEVTEAGAISLFGAAGAANGTLPMIDTETGKLTWKTLEDIGAGDGNDNTTYEFAFADQKITITPKFNGQPIMEGEEGAQTQVKYELDLSSFVTGDELTEAIKDFATKSYVDGEVDKLEKAISDIDFVDERELATALEPYAKTEDLNTALAGKADKTALEALQGTVDAFLTGTGTVEDTLDSLQELINYINTHDDADISGILASIKVVEDKLAGVDTTVVDYVTAAINALKIGDYAKAADLANLATRVKALEDADNFTQAEFDAFNTTNSQAIEKAKTDAISDAATKYAPKTTVYTKEEIDNLLEGVQGGASESAASVNTKLEAYKKVVNAEIWGDEAGAGDASGNSRIDLLESAVDALEAVGAQANVIEEVKGATDNRLSISTSGKVVTIDDANLRTDIAATKKASDDAAATANANAQAINGHDTRISNLETAKNAQSEQIAALIDADTTLGNKILALETTVNNAESGVAANAAKAAQNASDIAALQATDTTHGKDIADLKVASGNNANEITNIKAALGNVYTKTEVDDKVQTINTELGKKLEAADLTSYAKSEDVAKTYATIEALNTEAARADAAEKANAKAIEDETARAQATEQKIAGDLALLIENPTDALDSVKELIEHVQANGTAVTGIIGRLDGHDSILAGIGGEGQKSTVKQYVDDAIDAIPAYELPAATVDALGGIKSAADVDGKAVANAVYVADDGKATVKTLSTDSLVQGNEELILNGGNATLSK